MNCRLGGVSFFCEKYVSFLTYFLKGFGSIVGSLITDLFFGGLSRIMSWEWVMSCVNGWLVGRILGSLILKRLPGASEGLLLS